MNTNFKRWISKYWLLLYIVAGISIWIFAPYSRIIDALGIIYWACIIAPIIYVWHRALFGSLKNEYHWKRVYKKVKREEARRQKRHEKWSRRMNREDGRLKHHLKGENEQHDRSYYGYREREDDNKQAYYGEETIAELNEKLNAIRPKVIEIGNYAHQHPQDKEAQARARKIISEYKTLKEARNMAKASY